MKNRIELKPITLDEEYRKKWNICCDDFQNLYVDGKKANDNLYRVGGLGFRLKDDYFMLLKQNEASYPNSITKIKERKLHLEDAWCIIDANGVEKVSFKWAIDSPYLSGGQIYSYNGNYYNIETGICYCRNSSSVAHSQDFIFVENKYDKNLSKRGVMRINKKDGTYKIYK